MQFSKFCKKCERLFLECWWVLLFLICCYLCYEQGLKHREVVFGQLKNQYDELQREKILALHQQKELLLQINSQSDPDWIELTLMKVLGLVNEGQTKVLFINGN